MKMKKVTINQYTIKKIEIYKHIGDSKRFVLLRGSIGVGKTLIAKELAKKLLKMLMNSMMKYGKNKLPLYLSIQEQIMKI